MINKTMLIKHDPYIYIRCKNPQKKINNIVGVVSTFELWENRLEETKGVNLVLEAIPV